MSINKVKMNFYTYKPKVHKLMADNSVIAMTP